ncbi:hypothetical protein P171DRAFT_131558 [Karstenula rhodostoma CBS 690.94]|uniref:Uncharacterized protein n=1 Tax=Karstenula rhodostoma CBS 690.94 TaxID=1392251 RepID=A0A9P4P924_9PLEO|nr:hypothetical protein P171DRAFT_131558 [Karstenula rhodostoma CBS 690.94]
MNQEGHHHCIRASYRCSSLGYRLPLTQSDRICASANSPGHKAPRVVFMRDDKGLRDVERNFAITVWTTPRINFPGSPPESSPTEEHLPNVGFKPTKNVNVPKTRSTPPRTLPIGILTIKAYGNYASNAAYRRIVTARSCPHLASSQPREDPGPRRRGPTPPARHRKDLPDLR